MKTTAMLGVLALGVLCGCRTPCGGRRTRTAIPPTLQPPQEQTSTAADRLPVRGGMSREDRRRKNVSLERWVTELYDNGDIYVGEQDDGKRDGRGTYTFRSGHTYIGEYRANVRSGNGVMIFVTGCSYLGGFKDGKFHGHGVFVFANGERYEGQFKDGFRHGPGLFRDVAGQGINGFWRADELVEIVGSDPDAQHDLKQRQTEPPTEAYDLRYVDP